MKEKILNWVVIVSVVAFGGVIVRSLYYLHDAPPKGYCVMMDDDGNYFVKVPNEWGGSIRTYKRFVHRSKQAAINQAWEIKGWRDSPPTKDEIYPKGQLTEIDCE